MMSWLSEGIEKIRELSHPAINTNGVLYWRDTKERVDKVYYPETLRVSTLAAIVACCTDTSAIVSPDAVLHVLSPTEVRLISQCDERQQRACYMLASSPRGSLVSGALFLEEAILALMTNCMETPEQQRLIAALSNVSQKSQIVTEDDGITQAVETREGVSLLKQEKMVSPIRLKPYTTFSEVEQPEILFRVRLKKDARGLVVSFYSCDGGTWALEAIKNVAEWLHAQLPTMTIYA